MSVSIIVQMKFKCNQIQKLCSDEIQILVSDYHPSSVTIMSDEHHRHDSLHPYDKQYQNTFIVFYL